MLTRRTATVTICAPDASSAAAFSSKLLYLPVPMISREVNVRPATVQLSALMLCAMLTSTPADEMDDLVIVAVLDHRLRQKRARDHREIALDRDSMRVESKLVEHVGNADPAVDPAMFTIDPNSKGTVERH